MPSPLDPPTLELARVRLNILQLLVTEIWDYVEFGTGDIDAVARRSRRELGALLELLECEIPL
jgi:hypothetical protein